jgi:catechol-2,3-dioxygenase
MDTRVHISIEVSDLANSIAFYTKLFRTDATKVRTDYANFRLESPPLHLALVHKPGRTKEPGFEQGGNRHFGVELFSHDILKAWLSTAQNSGLVIRVEEDITCCYAKADKFWAQDPDGHEWEVWVRTAEAESMHDETKAATKTAACCAPSCCA